MCQTAGPLEGWCHGHCMQNMKALEGADPNLCPILGAGWLDYAKADRAVVPLSGCVPKPHLYSLAEGARQNWAEEQDTVVDWVHP